MSKKIEGILTAIVTTFDENGDFCPKRMRKQVQRQLNNGNSVFCNGTNGFNTARKDQSYRSLCR